MAATRRQSRAAVMLAAAFVRLLADPRRFGFDAAVRLVMRVRGRADPVEAVTFRTAPSLAYPAAEVPQAADADPARPPVLTVTTGGLTGPSGVLPRFYTEQVIQQVRLRAEGLHAFVDMLGQRMLAAFAEAGIKYRPARAAEQARIGRQPDPHRGVLLALVGDAAPARAAAPDASGAVRDTQLYFAGFHAAWPRSADRLEAMLSEWMGQPVRVRQFEGAWLDLPPAERTRLPAGRAAGQFGRLGHDAAIGTRSWDAHGRVVIRIEGMTLASFRGLLPDREDTGRLHALVRGYLGQAADFAINPVLQQDQVPDCALGGGARLGWDGWLTARPRRRGGDEARFSAGMIERVQQRRAGT